MTERKPEKLVRFKKKMRWTFLETHEVEYYGISFITLRQTEYLLKEKLSN